MNTRHHWLFGLASLGLVLAAPVQASPDFMHGAFIVAERDRDQAGESRKDRREDRQDARRASRREAERDEPSGYGYGYERRQKQRSDEDRRPRDRR